MFKHNKSIIIFFLLCFCCSYCFVFADDITEDITEPVSLDEFDTSEPASVVIDITQLLNKDEKNDDPIEVIPLEKELVDITISKTAVTPSDASGFKAVMLTILGDYETVVTDYTYQNNNNYYSHSIEIEQDYAWIASACMLGLIVYCTFRSIGGILCRV